MEDYHQEILIRDPQGETLKADHASTSSIHESVPPIPWMSVLQVLFGTFSSLALFTMAFVTAFSALLDTITLGIESSGLLAYFVISGSLVFIGLLTFPVVYFALAHILNWKIPQWLKREYQIPGILPILLLPVIMLAGGAVIKFPVVSWLFLPMLHILGIGLPIFGIIEISKKNLRMHSPRQLWGVFSSGLILAPALIMTIEIVALGIGLLVIVGFVSNQPGLFSEFETFALSSQDGTLTQEAILAILQPLINDPRTIFIMLFFAAAVVPVIEEIIKPIGVWLICGASITPAQGFTAGVLSGAGYALFESLMLGSAIDEWGVLVLARAGTGVVHIFTTGLTGWAIASAIKEDKYLRLGISYLLSVTIHSLWNGLTVLNLFTTLSNKAPTQPIEMIFSHLGKSAPLSLVFLTAAIFIVLVLANRKFQRISGTISPLPE